MKKYLYNYKHIISEQIIESKIPHPLDNLKDKSIFIEYLLNDLQIDSFEDISENKKNLFRVYFDKLYYNVFIEFSDGGGTDISFNRTTKKVAIPFHQKAFKKIINNWERVLVINMYVPLNNEGKPDFLKRVYLIVDPKEIYSSKVIEKGTNNSSSRWFKLEDVIYTIENKTYKKNNKNNVYIIYWEKLKWFFENILKEEYINMIKTELIKTNILDFKSENNKKYKKYRKLFRELLIANRGIKCEIINCKINILELMIASHIKPVKNIINDDSLNVKQKIIEISDPNNGFLLCPNHDALFDKFLITFNKEGYLKISKKIIDNIINFNLLENEKSIFISDKKTIEYLKFHNNQFENK